MMLILTCEIHFPATETRQGFRVRNVERVEISSSWKNLTDTASITMPTKWVAEETAVSLRDWIQPGDAVVVSLGYGSALQERFRGYVRQVTPGPPLVIACEDAMWLLKRRRLTLSYRSVRLPALAADLVAGTGLAVDAEDIDLGAFRVENATPAKVLESLRDKYGLVAYIGRTGALVVGKVYRNSPARPAGVFDIERNIRQDNLEYEVGRAISVRAISNLPNGQKLEVEVGDPDGEQRTLNYYGITELPALRTLAEADLAKLQVAGYQGNFSAYGAPVIQHSDVVTLRSSRYPDRAGNYYVEGVDIDFSANGYVQKIAEGGRAA